MDCKYYKNEIVNGIKHEKCTNEKLKIINNAEDKDIPCIGKNCGLADANENIDNENSEAFYRHWHLFYGIIIP